MLKLVSDYRTSGTRCLFSCWIACV